MRKTEKLRGGFRKIVTKNKSNKIKRQESTVKHRGDKILRNTIKMGGTLGMSSVSRSPPSNAPDKRRTKASSSPTLASSRSSAAFGNVKVVGGDDDEDDDEDDDRDDDEDDEDDDKDGDEDGDGKVTNNGDGDGEEEEDTKKGQTEGEKGAITSGAAPEATNVQNSSRSNNNEFLKIKKEYKLDDNYTLKYKLRDCVIEIDDNLLEEQLNFLIELNAHFNDDKFAIFPLLKNSNLFDKLEKNYDNFKDDKKNEIQSLINDNPYLIIFISEDLLNKLFDDSQVKLLIEAISDHLSINPSILMNILYNSKQHVELAEEIYNKIKTKPKYKDTIEVKEIEGLLEKAKLPETQTKEKARTGEGPKSGTKANTIQQRPSLLTRSFLAPGYIPPTRPDPTPQASTPTSVKAKPPRRSISMDDEPPTGTTQQTQQRRQKRRQNFRGNRYVQETESVSPNNGVSQI